MLKNFTMIILFLVFFSGFPSSPLAKDGDKKNEVSKSTVASLLLGLNSDNIGLKCSSAYMLGELKVSSAVVPLMRVLHNDDNEKVRISAVLALYKIGTPMSVNAVKQAIKFDDSKRVSTLANKFYNDFLREEFSKTNEQTTEKLLAHTD